MIIKDNSNSKDFPPTPSGLHPAVCYGVVDVGTHIENYLGQEKDRHIVYILWELPNLTIEIDEVTKPRAISKKYTLSMHPKATLRSDLESWRGKRFGEHEARQGFDISKLLGVNCQLNIIHTDYEGKTIAKVSSIVPLGMGMRKYDNFNDLVIYEISQGADIPEQIPQWLKEKIFASREMNELGQMNLRDDQIWNSEPKQEPGMEPDYDVPPVDAYDDDIAF